MDDARERQRKGFSEGINGLAEIVDGLFSVQPHDKPTRQHRKQVPGEQGA